MENITHTGGDRALAYILKVDNQIQYWNDFRDTTCWITDSAAPQRQYDVSVSLDVCRVTAANLNVWWPCCLPRRLMPYSLSHQYTKTTE